MNTPHTPDNQDEFKGLSKLQHLLIKTAEEAAGINVKSKRCKSFSQERKVKGNLVARCMEVSK